MPCTTQKLIKENNYFLWTLRLDAFLRIPFLYSENKMKCQVQSSNWISFFFSVKILVCRHIQDMLLLLITQMCMCFEYVFWNSNVLDKLYAPYPWSGNSYRIHLTPNVKKKKRGVSILWIETWFFYFRYYLICKYNGMWGLEINSYICSILELIEKQKYMRENTV